MNTSQEEQKKLTVLAMKNYLNSVNNTSYNGTLLEQVYYFFESNGNWSDNTNDFQFLSVHLLKALSTKEVREVLKKELGESYLNDLANLMVNLFMLTKTMSSENFRTLLHIYEVDQMRDHSIDELERLENEYKRKTEAIGLEKGRKLVDIIKESERTKNFA